MTEDILHQMANTNEATIDFFDAMYNEVIKVESECLAIKHSIKLVCLH